MGWRPGLPGSRGFGIPYIQGLLLKGFIGSYKGLGFGFRVSGLVFRVCRVCGSGLRVLGFGGQYGVLGPGFRVLGFRAV